MKNDEDKTKEQLMNELVEIRQRVAKSEASEAEHKQAETTLSIPEEYFRLFELLPIGATLLDMKGVILYCNSAVYNKGGYTEGEFTGKHFSKIASVRVKDIPKFIRVFNSTVRGKIPKPFESIYQRKDGTTGWTELNISLIKVGGKRRILVMQHDIIERKAIEEERRMYTTGIDNANEGIAFTKMNGDMLYFNESACRIFGYTPAEMGEINISKFSATSADGGKLEGSLREKGEFFGEIIGQRKNGEMFPATLSVTIVNDDEGNPIGRMGVFSDITERKQVEEVLLKNRNLLNETGKMAKVGGWEFDTITLEQTWTEEIYRIHELDMDYQPTVEDGISFYAPEAVPIISKAVQRTIDYDEPFDLELPFITAKGNHRWVHAIGKAYRKDGKVTKVGGTFQDITERKQSEQLIRTQAEVTKNMAEGAYIVGLHDIIIRWANPRFEELFGYEPGEMIGKHASIVNAPTDLTPIERAGEIMEVIRRTTEWHGEVHNIKKDGTPFWCYASVSVFTHPEYGEVLLAVHTDITERKRAEEALRKSEGRFRRLFEQSNDAVFIHNLEGKLLDVNSRVCDMLGYDKDTLLKMTVPALHPEEEFPASKKALQTTMKTGSVRFESKFKKADGTTINVDISSSVIDLEGGIVQGIARDITERKQLEEEQERIERLESLGTLAGGIAHDFNNLLTGIMGNIGLAKRYVEPEGKAFERLGEAERASVRAKDLTQQLLTFGRGGMPVKKLATISELIKETATFALRGSNISLGLSLLDDLWTVEVDEGQIGQVIQSIVMNADESMPSGGTLHISTQNVVIKRLGALPLLKGNYIRIDIEDEGIGMSKEQLERMYEPYYTTKQKGSGLGLATAYSIIKNHGGYIAAESKVGVGTKFFVYIPTSTKPMPEKERETAEVPIMGKGRILVMDDEEIIRQLLGDELTDAGYEVELTVDGAEAIERYEDAKKSGKPFDAVILDLTVPGGMGGREVIEKLLEIDPKVKAIVSSGYAIDPVMSECKKYGFSAVVAKPYNVTEIEKTLHNLLRILK